MNIKRKFILFLWGVVVLQLSACATMFNSGRQVVHVDSSPPAQVDVMVSDNRSTAYRTTLPSDLYFYPSSFSDLTITLDDPCYAPGFAIIEKKITPSTWLNWFSAPLYFVGFPVDYFTGRMWKYNEHLTMPVQSLKTCSEDQMTVDNKVSDRLYQTSFSQLSKRKPKNLLGFNWFLTNSVDTRIKGNQATNLGISYIRRINSENMINIAYKRSNRNTCIYCGSYRSTTQTSMLLSLRQYLTPTSDFYAGLGGAIVGVQQRSVQYFNSANKPLSQWEDRFTTVFIEAGWLMRKGSFVYSANGVLDFSDIGLNVPSLSNRSYLNRDRLDGNVRRYDMSYRAASRVTSVELSIHFQF